VTKSRLRLFIFGQYGLQQDRSAKKHSIICNYEKQNIKFAAL